MELLEREAHLQELAGAWQDAAVGAGRVALVSGEAGSGKTSLVERFVHERQDSSRVLWGACDALFTPRPLGPLHDMAAQIKGNLPDLLKSEAASRTTIFSTVLVELQSRPTIAVFEDVHWADEATLDLLKYLGRRVTRASALIVLTFRDDELDPKHPLRTLLGDIATSSAVRRIPLSSLSEKAVRVLVGKRAIDATKLHRQTAGNPFFVTEVLSSPEGGLPATIRDAVLARAARLSASGQAVLQAAAVIGPRIEPWVLADVTGAEAKAAEECLAIGILVTQGEMLAFRHELARQTILESLSPPRKLALHQMTLDALKNSPVTRDDLTRLAHHAEAANDREAVLTYAPAAAKQAAAAGSHHAASDLYRLGLRFADDLPPAERAELWDAYAFERQPLEPRQEAITALRQAAELWREANNLERQGDSLAHIATALLEIGQHAECEQAVTAALSVLDTLPLSRMRMMTYRTWAMLNLYKAEDARAISLAEESLSFAQQLEDPSVIASAYEGLGICWLGTDPVRACEHLEHSLALQRGAAIDVRFGGICANLSSVYCEYFQFEKAERVLAEGLAFVAERDLDRIHMFMLGWQALMYLYQGRWDEAADLATHVWQNPGRVTSGQIPALTALGRVRARRGDPGAEAALDEVLGISIKQGNLQRIGIPRAAWAEAAWLAGKRALTLEHARAVYDIVVSKHHPWLTGELAFWRWRAGDEVQPLPEWTARPFALHIAGDWRAAAQEWERLGCPYEQARALADGDHQAQLAALEIFDRLGARPAADELRERMRAEGVRNIPRGPRPATRDNPYGLTDRQMEILGLLVEDLTNAEIAARLHLSPKTVDRHVSAVLAKLDVHSREEAAKLARGHPLFHRPTP
jgi:DNA-binding CsgD family transcriptional regulator/tetratricopeptide (TPR) repeat protein